MMEAPRSVPTPALGASAPALAGRCVSPAGPLRVRGRGSERRYSDAMDIWIPILIVVVLLLVVGIYFWATYNTLVSLGVRVDEAWSDITVQLKRRADLIPNLISSVKGY